MEKRSVQAKNKTLSLFINTTIAKKAVVSLIGENGDVIEQVEESEPLLAIDRLLKKTKTSLSDLSDISFHPGPGSYTGIRIGSAISSALNFALERKVKNIPIVYEESSPVEKK